MFKLASYVIYIVLILNLYLSRNRNFSLNAYFLFKFLVTELEIQDKHNGSVVRILIWIPPVF